jgi:serine/threonine protein kinase
MRVPDDFPLRIGELLGEGAAGLVYAAENDRGESVAVKFLRADLTEDPEIVGRFVREAKIAQAIISPFVAPVLGAGSTDHSFWIVYRRLVGETLQDRIRREVVLAPAALERIVEHILRGLAAAHAAGVVHRDIKPANVMLERTAQGERACIMDFGVSKYRPLDGHSTSQDPLTSSTATLGTVNYMAPEQVGGAAHVDARADLYAAGVIAFQALCGALPFAGEAGAILHAKLNEKPRTLSQAATATWPPAAESFFARALARHPEARFEAAEAMLKNWRDVIRADELPSVDDLRARAQASHSDDDTLRDPAPQ